MTKQPLINFSISTAKYQEFVQHIIELGSKKISSIVCVANVHMFIEAYKDPSFLNIINSAEVVTPDGKPLIVALKMLYGIKQDRVAGMDLLPDLLKEMSQQQLSVYFYGGTQAMLDKTGNYLKENYPSLKIAGLYSPPFKPLSAAEENEIVEKINSAAPAIIFVILGCPKQERWMASMKGRINAVMVGVGGALPVLIGLQKRAPLWMQNYALEWLFRLYQEPFRLFKRYAVTNSLFLWLMFKQLIRTKLLVPLKLTKVRTI
jgi:N-acetylglucosaminyldiphosphoundecaprenol N-acetyl-beta-D-mannosaminyltransferase